MYKLHTTITKQTHDQIKEIAALLGLPEKSAGRVIELAVNEYRKNLTPVSSQEKNDKSQGNG